MKSFSPIKSARKIISMVLSMLLPSIAMATDEMPDIQSNDNTGQFSIEYSSDGNSGLSEDADSLYLLYFPKAEFHSIKIEEVPDTGLFQRAPVLRTVDTYVPSLVYVDSDYVGGIPVESGVSPTGARTYNIPLRIPDGINGMTPSISLAYNSQGPNSVMGPGWSVSGLPVIIRAGKSIYYDGIADAIRNDTTDSFFLDGVRMIKTSAGNGHIDYDTEFGNIKARGYVSHNDISHFDIYYPDGRSATFIQKYDSTNMAYHVSSIKDMWGNTITYRYDYINDCWTLAGIGYSDYEITFTYSRRKSPVSGFRGGVFLPENNLLKEIAIGRRGQTPHLYYTMDYALRGNFQLLSTIRLWNENDDYTPALTMFYGTGQTRDGWTESKSRLTQWYSTTNPNSINICLGRMDGQGGSEAVVVYPRCEPYYKNLDPSIPGTKCTLINKYRGNEKIIVYPDISYPMSLTAHTIETGEGFTDLFCTDLDGSGSDMLVKVNSNFASEGIKRMDRITFTTYEWSPGSFLSVRHTRNYDLPVKWMTDNPNFTIPLYFFPGDYDGDGKTEIMAMSSNYPLGYTHLPSKCYIFDLEGDSIKYEGHVIDFDVTFTGVDLPDPTVAIGRSGTGVFSYDNPVKPYAVTGIGPQSDRIPEHSQQISYTSFNRVASLSENGNNVKFNYGQDDSRVTSVLTLNGKTVSTTKYLGDCYESLTRSGMPNEERLYLGGGYYDAPAVLVKTDSVQKIIYIVRDYLGSIRLLTDENGTVLQEFSYDPWGNLRNPDNHVVYETGQEPELMLGRGFTGHEHRPLFGLIDMNARMYDPVLGRFVSADPYVANPDFTQSLNRYSYCLNNPLSYVDRDGEVAIVIPMLIGGLFNLAYQGITGNIHSFGDGLVAFGVGALAGGLGGFAGGWAFSAAGGITLGGGGFIAGAASGAIATAVEVQTQNIGNHLFFGDPFLSFEDLMMDAAVGGIFGGAVNGITSARAGRNFWTGDKIAPGRGTFSLINTPDRKFQADLLRSAQFEQCTAAVCAEIENQMSTKPLQTHHFISPVNQKYTPQFRKITDPLGLDLNGSWNKAQLPHQGRHPYAYHEFVYNRMLKIKDIPNLTPELFKLEFKRLVIDPVMRNPDMLYKNYWLNK